MAVNNNVTNPSIASGSTPLRVVTGTYHLVIATGASVTVAPIYGLLKTTVAMIALIWNGFSCLINSTYLNKMKKELSNLTKTEKNLQTEELTQKINDLSKKITNYELRGIDLSDNLQESKQALFAGVLTTIPLFGVVLASAYLKAIHPIEETGAHGLVEAGFSELTRDLIRLLRMVSKNGGTLLQMPLYPCRGQSISKYFKKQLKIEIDPNDPNAHTWFTNLLQDKKISLDVINFIKIPVNRGENQSPDLKGLDAAWIKNKNKDAPTMVVFHGNGQTMHTMHNQIAFYYNQGFNVLAVTMGGYPGSDEDKVITSESSTYQDADAVIKYLKDKQGATEIGVHGTSIGGTLAFAAAELHPDIKLVVADRTLDMAKNVSANAVKNVIGSVVPTAIIRGITSGIFSSRVVHGVKNSDNTSYRTDGLNNLRKAKFNNKITEQPNLFVIKANQDLLMGRNKRSTDKYELSFKENFAGDLFRARYPDINKNSLTMNEYDLNQFNFSGGHCTAWNDSKIIRDEDSENPFHRYFKTLASNSEEKE